MIPDGCTRIDRRKSNTEKEGFPKKINKTLKPI